MIDINFIKAGNATFTFANPAKERYTFKVKYSEKLKRYFMYMLTGSNNETDYTYVGVFDYDQLVLTRASKYKQDSKPVRVFNYAIQVILGYKELLPEYFLEHNEHCGKCGRKLTTPESIKCGLGPICRSKIA